MASPDPLGARSFARAGTAVDTRRAGSSRASHSSGVRPEVFARPCVSGVRNSALVLSPVTVHRSQDMNATITDRYGDHLSTDANLGTLMQVPRMTVWLVRRR